MQKIKKTLIPKFLVVCICLFSVSASADTWKLPSKKVFTSENGKFKLIVTPEHVPNKYYDWSNYKENCYPKKKKALRKKENFMKTISERDTVITPCFGELYKITNNDSVLIWKRKLLNHKAPVSGIIANDGLTVATFDNWYYYGYGVNVFVIYNKKGDAKRTYKLEEFSPFPLNDYLISVSSLYWRQEVKFLDNDTIELIFENENNETIRRIYNVSKLEFEK